MKPRCINHLGASATLVSREIFLWLCSNKASQLRPEQTGFGQPLDIFVKEVAQFYKGGNDSSVELALCAIEGKDVSFLRCHWFACLELPLVSWAYVQAKRSL